jgi:hypothetical protein
MAAVMGSTARFTTDEPELAGYEEAGSRSSEKAESKTDASNAYDNKASSGIVDVAMEGENGNAEAEQDEACLKAEEDAAEGGADLVFFDGDGLEEAAAGLVGGEGGEGVRGVDALEDFFLKAGLCFGDEVSADGGEDDVDDEADGEGD